MYGTCMILLVLVDFQRWGIEPAVCRTQIERTIAKVKIEIANLESQLNDAAVS